METAFQAPEVSSMSEDGDGENGAEHGVGCSGGGRGRRGGQGGLNPSQEPSPGSLVSRPAVLTAEVAEFRQALCLSNQADGAQPMAVRLPTTLAQVQKADDGP